MNRPDPQRRKPDPYRGVVIVLLAAAVLGAAGAIAGGIKLSDPVLFAVALTLGLSAAVLSGVATAQALRLRPMERAEISLTFALESVSPKVAEPNGAETENAGAGQASETSQSLRIAEKLRSRLTTVSQRMAWWYRGGEAVTRIRRGTALAGGMAIWLLRARAAGAWAWTPFCFAGADRSGCAAAG